MCVEVQERDVPGVTVQARIVLPALQQEFAYFVMEMPDASGVMVPGMRNAHINVIMGNAVLVMGLVSNITQKQVNG